MCVCMCGIEVGGIFFSVSADFELPICMFHTVSFPLILLCVNDAAASTKTKSERAPYTETHTHTVCMLSELMIIGLCDNA